MPSFTLSPLDLSLIGLYMVLVVAAGLYLGRKHEDADQYFLAGRSMLWPFIGVSLFASNISSTTLVGLAGSAYANGISVYNYEWMAAVVLVIFAVFFLPLYLRSRVYTMPEFLERRFDGRSRTYFSLLTLLGNIIIDTAGSLYAGGLVLRLIFPEIPMWQMVAGLALVAGIYTIAGGLAAVIYTDAIQTVLLLAGSVIVTVKAFQRVGSWEAVTAVTPPDKLSLIRPIGDPTVPWPGLLLGVSLLGFYFWCTNQFMVQRVLSAKSLDHGRWGVLLAGALKLPVIFIMVLPGTMARLLYPDLGQPDLVYPTLVFDLLPSGVLGLVVAGLIAALMSSIDSTLNSASTLVTMDFVSRLKSKYDSHQLMRVGRLATFLFMVLAAAWAPQIGKFPTLWQYLQGVLAYVAPPVVAVFVLGVFWKRANAQGAFVSLVGGALLAILLLTFRDAAWMPQGLHFLYVAPILFCASMAIAVTVSLATSPPDPERIRPYMWSRRLFAEESAELRGTAWYRSYRVLGGLLLALTAVVVAMFW